MVDDDHHAMFVNKSISATSLSSVMTVTGSIVQWATSSHLPLLHASKYLGWTEYVMFLAQMLHCSKLLYIHTKLGSSWKC